MQKSIVISILLFIVLSCEDSNKKASGDAGSMPDTILNHDTLKHSRQITADSGSKLSNTQKSFPASKNISMVENKMENKAILNDVDHGIIGKFLMQNKDESISEGVGYSLFEYFSKNGAANERYSSFLNKKGSAYKEKILEKLIGIMCIDLGENKYTCDKLISDFSLFNGSNSAQMALKTCIDNYIN